MRSHRSLTLITTMTILPSLHVRSDRSAQITKNIPTVLGIQMVQKVQCQIFNCVDMLQAVREETKSKSKRGADADSDTEEASSSVRKRIKKGKKGKSH